MATNDSPLSVAALRELALPLGSGPDPNPPAAFTAMIAEDFESKTLGAATDDGWWKSDYVDTISKAGSKSLKLRASMRETGSCPYGEAALFFGGRQPTPANVPVGETVWQRIYLYFPTTYSFGYMYSGGDSAELSACGLGTGDDGNATRKFLVFSPNSGTARIYLNYSCSRRQISQPSDARLWLFVEANTAGNVNAECAIPLGRWFALQFAVKVATNNTGWARAWLDDELILESTGIQTIAGSASAVTEWGIGDYWNGYPWFDGEADRDSFYVDDVVVASTASGYGAPTGEDASGNAYISPLTLAGDL